MVFVFPRVSGSTPDGGAEFKTTIEMTEETKQKILTLKEECDLFHEQVSRKMDDLCNNELDFKEGSMFSHVGDRLDLFINDFNDFILTQKW